MIKYLLTNIQTKVKIAIQISQIRIKSNMNDTPTDSNEECPQHVRGNIGDLEEVAMPQTQRGLARISL